MGRDDRALSAAGFIRYEIQGMEMFLDVSDAGTRDAVRVLIENEKVRPEYTAPTPDVSDVVKPEISASSGLRTSFG
ncbi:MAG TPA: hypothetical protein VF624_14515 [Tepidisphaeraceae bacterium]